MTLRELFSSISNGFSSFGRELGRELSNLKNYLLNMEVVDLLSIIFVIAIIIGILVCYSLIVEWLNQEKNKKLKYKIEKIFNWLRNIVFITIFLLIFCGILISIFA